MTATDRRRRRSSGGPSRCSWCGADIMWMRHVRTGKSAPIDWSPVPGGNILIHAVDDTYEVLAGSERAAGDPTVEDENATPTLRLNHWMTCSSTKADAIRKASAERRAVSTEAFRDRAAGPDL
jgi:hypothetical protein